MDGESASNGLQPRPDIKFGPHDHQVISAEVASMVLQLWREKNPAQFGAVLAEVMTGAKPKAGRS